MEQCQFYGQRNVPFMGRLAKELVRCQERGTEFWHDEIGDAYCPRHERLIKGRAARARKGDHR
jgi:hypothetical protein